MRTSCDLSYSEAASEGEEFSGRLFDIAACDSSATDEDGDYEPRPSRKRGGAQGGAITSKKVKQESAPAEDDDTGLTETDLVCVLQTHQAPNTYSQITQTLWPKKALSSCCQPQHGQHVGCEGSMDPETEVLGGGSCTAGTTEQAERCSSATETTTKNTGTSSHVFMPSGEQNITLFLFVIFLCVCKAEEDESELEKLRALLLAERSRNQQMTEMISNLKQDKELLQHELTKKAELICEFLQDKLRPGKLTNLCRL